MKTLTTTIGIAAWLSCLLAGCATMQASEVGKQEYQSRCATCHGASGKGDGPKAQSLPIKPANLTMLAKNNGGVFPAERITAVIDGRVEVMAHGPREMPVWGVDLQVVPRSLPQPISDEPFGMQEPAVQGKIKALVDYVARLQEK